MHCSARASRLTLVHHLLLLASTLGRRHISDGRSNADARRRPEETRPAGPKLPASTKYRWMCNAANRTYVGIQCGSLIHQPATLNDASQESDIL